MAITCPECGGGATLKRTFTVTGAAVGAAVGAGIESKTGNLFNSIMPISGGITNEGLRNASMGAVIGAQVGDRIDKMIGVYKCNKCGAKFEKEVQNGNR